MTFSNIFSSDYDWLNIDNDSNSSYLKIELRNGQTDQNYNFEHKWGGEEYNWGQNDYDYLSEY